MHKHFGNEISLSVSDCAFTKMYKRKNCTQIKSINATADNINNDQIIFENELHTVPEYQLIFGLPYQSSLILYEANVLFNKLLKHWVQIEEAVLEDTYSRTLNYKEITQGITLTLELFHYSLQTCRDNNKQTAVENALTYIKLLDSIVKRWATLNERLLNKIISKAVHDHTQPLSYYYHTYLDIHWLIVTLQYICNVQVNNLEALIKDLIVASYTLYKKNETNLHQSAFICSCTKSLWLLLQCFTEKSHKNDFWNIFNNVVKNYDEAFVLWMLYNVATLQGYDYQGQFIGSHHLRVVENYTLIESTLKSLNGKCVARKENNTLLLNCCSMIYTLMSEWWTNDIKSEPYQILWEIFHKHMNISFDEPPKIESASELMDIVNHISISSKNSYQYFLFMLKAHLLKYPNQWSRIRGRIYSKLPNNKIKELTNVGLYNIGLLFLSLGNNANLSEISEKLMSLLANLPHTDLIFHIQISLAILHAQRGVSVQAICHPLVVSIEEIVEKREKYSLVRAYIDGFDNVFKANNNYSLQQSIMISKWVQKYLQNCSFSDLCYFLNILSCNIKVLKQDYSWPEWETVLKQHILPGLKSIATSSNCPSQVGTLAALIDSSTSSDYVLIFTSDLINVNVACNYLTSLLEQVPDFYCGLPKNHETAILHAWTRCCLLNCEGIHKLSRNVSKIGVLSEVFDANAQNPLCGFINLLSKCTSKLINQQELCEQCFGRVDNWILPYIASPASEASALHIYTAISLLFYNCAEFLYHKNRSSCLLNRLVNFFLLSTDILMGKKPHMYVLSAIQRTWHLFMQGIYTLDGSSDAYIERTLRDMVARYLPLLSTEESPILKCFKNDRLTTFILERISSNFLSHTSRSLEVNTLKALKIIHLAIENMGCVELILWPTLSSVFETIMFHNNKSMAIDLVKFIILSEERDDVRQSIKAAFISVTEKHLAFRTNQYFQFTNLLAGIIPNMKCTLMPLIKKQVVEVERMRGVGYDNTLRQGLERLETLLK